MARPIEIVVLEGDETGQELLEQALRVLDPDVVGLPIELDRHDLSLARRRETGNEVVHEAARAMVRSGLGIKAATITPEGKDDVGSPNRIVRQDEPDDALGCCALCGDDLGDTRVLVVRHRGRHRIADGFCRLEHLHEWAKGGGRYRAAS